MLLLLGHTVPTRRLKSDRKTLMLALPCPRPRPDALPEPGGSGRTWGGAGLRNLAFLVSVLRPHLLTYVWGWSRCLDRCRRALPLSCSFLHPCWTLPAPLLCLSGPCCLALLPGLHRCLPPAFLLAPSPSSGPPPLTSAQGSRYPLGGFGYMIRAPKNTSDTGGSEGQKHVGAKLGSYSPSNQGKVAHAS